MTSTMMILVMATVINLKNPINLAILTMACSIITSMMIFKGTLTSWASLILIMIFSSGMMTLFIYVASLSPNEKNKNKIQMLLVPLVFCSMVPSQIHSTKSKNSMMNFSSQSVLMMMTMVLILTMLTISNQSFNPHQSMSSTF